MAILEEMNITDSIEIKTTLEKIFLRFLVYVSKEIKHADGIDLIMSFQRRPQEHYLNIFVMN